MDFIGGQGSLTIDEEKSLSDFFKERKVLPKNTIMTEKIRTVK